MIFDEKGDACSVRKLMRAVTYIIGFFYEDYDLCNLSLL